MPVIERKGLRAHSFTVAHVTGEKRPVVFLHVAEAEVERLREALEQIAGTNTHRAARIAREALDAR